MGQVFAANPGAAYGIDHVGFQQRNLPIILDLTTSTGEPMQTAKKPAPKPDARWQGTVSENKPVAIRLCLICTHNIGAWVHRCVCYLDLLLFACATSWVL